ncbi:PfkB family carbohydrate kinase [Luteimonas gilva]|uniref:PfkB family carbohydrate kinase n=1 Tax=Luteimonas gilva TaxID=2572684 RepID=UPI001CB96ACF|nr:PfkB family carbohydrate kinase [Luteimonas gilva]
MRAACVLAGMGNTVTLHTVLGNELAGEFEQIASLKGFALQAARRDHEITFVYQHPLGVPEIDGESVGTEPRSAISADAALVFGMIEGRPIVHGDRVVYDPQDGDRAASFSSNGSSAKELAIVASLSEARSLSGKETPEDAASELLNQGGHVVIVKCGMLGAVVATAAGLTWIRAFPTDYVWKIGSGDVFSAAFAHAWLVEGLGVLDAAWFASRWVAEYVSTRCEALGAAELERVRAEAAAQAMPRNRPTINPKPIYLAGPFFNTAQLWQVEEARTALHDAGVAVFSPIHDVGEGPADEVAPEDLRAIRECGLVLALLDGLDAGTLFEVGYARALGIPVVAIAESVEEQSLTMIIGSGCIVRSDFCSGIYEACWQLLVDE